MISLSEAGALRSYWQGLTFFALAPMMVALCQRPALFVESTPCDPETNKPFVLLPPSARSLQHAFSLRPSIGSIARSSQLILRAATRRPMLARCCGRRSQSSGVCRRRAETMPDQRDPDRVRHEIFARMMGRAAAIACGYEDGIDSDRLLHDPLMKVAVGRCPESGAAQASQSTISRLEIAPSKIEAARLACAH
jgi:Transposase DDE domain group 1